MISPSRTSRSCNYAKSDIPIVINTIQKTCTPEPINADNIIG